MSILSNWKTQAQNLSNQHEMDQQTETTSSNSFVIHVKDSYPITSIILKKLISEIDSSVGTAIDGLIFTPEQPYTFGCDPFLLKWQSSTDIKANLTSEEFVLTKPSTRNTVGRWTAALPITARSQTVPLKMNNISNDTKKRNWSILDNLDETSTELLGLSSKRQSNDVSVMTSNEEIQLPTGFIYECKWSSERECWIPLCVRIDKMETDDERLITNKQEMIKKAELSTLTSITLLSLFETELATNSQSVLPPSSTIEMSVDSKAEVTSISSDNHSLELNSIKDSIIATENEFIHPSRLMEFDHLMSAVDTLISFELVEKYTDPETGLEVYSYCDRSGISVNDITIPKELFERKLSNNTMNATYLKDICRGLVVHPPTQTIVATPFVRFRKPTQGEIQSRSDRIVRASPKLDGSLIIAFIWNDKLYTSTRRRMNSEQAIWARSYLRSSQLVLQEFKPQWTYALELIGGDNKHVIDYTVEQSLVLLTAWNAQGVESSYEERLQIAQRAGLPVASIFTGRLQEFMATVSVQPTIPHEDVETVSNIHSTTNNNGLLAGPMPASFEGWVIEDSADGRRFKLINPEWDRASSIIKLLVHPAVVWDAIRMNKLDKLIKHDYLPNHAKIEIDKMAYAIACQFDFPIFVLALDPGKVASNERKTKELEEMSNVTGDAKGGRAASWGSNTQGMIIGFDYESGTVPIPPSVVIPGRSTQVSTTIASEEDTLSVSIPVTTSTPSHTPTDGFNSNNLDQVLVDSLVRYDATLLTSTLFTADCRDIKIDVPSIFRQAYSKSRPIFTNKEYYMQLQNPLSTKIEFSLLPASFPLRLLLLHYARPSLSGEIVGYTPSPWLAQTFAKGWSKMPVADMLSWGERGSHSGFDRIMPYPTVLKTIFSMLAPKEITSVGRVDLPCVASVCKGLRNNLNSMFRDDLPVWKQQHNETVALRQRIHQAQNSGRRFHSSAFGGGSDFGDGYDHDYYDYYDNDDWW